MSAVRPTCVVACRACRLPTLYMTSSGMSEVIEQALGCMGAPRWSYEAGLLTKPKFSAGHPGPLALHWRSPGESPETTRTPHIAAPAQAAWQPKAR